MYLFSLARNVLIFDAILSKITRSGRETPSRSMVFTCAEFNPPAQGFSRELSSIFTGTDWSILYVNCADRGKGISNRMKANRTGNYLYRNNAGYFLAVIFKAVKIRMEIRELYQKYLE